MKKLVSFCLLLALSVCMVIGAIPVGAAENVYSGECGRNATWTFDPNTGTLEISGSGDMTEYERADEIPWYEYSDEITAVSIKGNITYVSISQYENLNSVTVSSDNSNYVSSGNCLIEKATKKLVFGCNNSVIPDDGSVTSIGDYAFCGLSELETVTIPDGVTSIGKSALSECTSLKSISIPDSLTEINTFFSGCPQLEYNEYGNAYYLGNDANPYVALVKAKDIFISSVDIHSSASFILTSAFSSCRNLSSITIPDNIKSIGTNLFVSCETLISVNLPNTITSIPDSTFYYCRKLESITLPSNLTEIGERAFYGCNSLGDINIPDSVASIGSDAFSGCAIKSITIPKAMTEIKGSAFKGLAELESITIPGNIKSVGYSAFEGCSKLKTVTLEDGVESLGYGAFGWLSSLESVVIPDSVTEFGTATFSSCSNLKSITMGNGIKRIGYGTFTDCVSLESIVIPASVQSIEYNAFSGCTGLKTVYIKSSAIVSKLTSLDACEGLIKNADTVAIEESCKEVIPNFILSSLPKATLTTYLGDNYATYTKTSVITPPTGDNNDGEGSGTPNLPENPNTSGNNNDSNGNPSQDNKQDTTQSYGSDTAAVTQPNDIPTFNSEVSSGCGASMNSGSAALLAVSLLVVLMLFGGMRRGKN